MPRILQVGDFIPDFDFSNAGQTVHSAAFGGQQWLLVMLRSSGIMRKYPELQGLVCGELADRLQPWVVALSAGDLPDGGIEGVRLFHANDATRLQHLFLHPHEETETVSIFTIDHAQKITGRLDCHPQTAPDGIERLVKEQKTRNSEPVANVIPVLKVPAALPEDFCNSIVQHYRESEEKIQGRAGLSTPTLDESVKRRMHVNADARLAKAIDRILVFSLLPAIERAFDYRVTYRVSYKIGSYSASQKGFFAAHRDNSDAGTTFRKFALSICLNDDWEGGGISFPEYSPAPLRLDTGDALVFPASLMHKVEPIQQGERFVLLSFMYDRQGAKLRRATMDNASLLDEKYIDAIDDEIVSAYSDFSPVPRFSPQYSRLK